MSAYWKLLLGCALGSVSVYVAVVTPPTAAFGRELPAPRLVRGPAQPDPHGLQTLLLDQYSRPPDDPAAPGDLFRPVFSGSFTSGAPLLSSATAAAGPGRSIILHGRDFTAAAAGTGAGTDAAVWIYSQTQAGNGRLVQARLEREGPQSVTVSVPEDFPYGTYLLWAENARGCSRPVRVNATEAWWVGPNRARPGARVGLYGRNLSHQNGDRQSYIYLRPWTSGAMPAASIAMTVVSVNPYQVLFDLPAGLAPGTYEVWAHNGHGGDYGWSGPVPLVVDAAAEPQWNGQRRNVASFGANPAEEGDDTAAFVQAFQAARNGDTIVIPKGVYRISAPLALEVSVSVEGEAADQTILEFVNGSGRAGAIFSIRGFPSRVRDVTFRSRVTSGLGHENAVVVWDGRSRNPTPRGVVVERTVCETQPGQLYSCYSIHSINEVRVHGNKFLTNSGVLLTRVQQAFLQLNSFRGIWPDRDYSPLTAIGASVSSQVVVEGNEATSADRRSGATLSRFYVAQGHSHGMTFNHYVADNHIYQTGCAALTCGENILVESPGTLHTGRASSIGETALTFTGVSWRPNLFRMDDPERFDRHDENRPSVLIVQSGTGEGQYRRIVSNTASTITVDRPWEIPPDTNSVLTVVTTAFHKVIFRNVIEGWEGAKDNRHRINVGVQSYGSMLDSVIARNKVSLLSRGIEISSLVNRSCGFAVAGISWPTTGNNCPTWGVLIEGNEISDTLHGITSWSRVEDPPREVAGPAMLNNIIRDNRIANAIQGGISIGDINRYRIPDSWQVDTVVEHNTTRNAPAVHLELLGLLEGPMLRHNRMINDDGSSSGVAIGFVAPAVRPVLYRNVTEGPFHEVFAGAVLPDESVQVSKRLIELTVTAGTAAEFTAAAVVTSTGTAEVPLLPSSDAGWLEASLSPGGTEGESLLRLRVDASQLPGGGQQTAVVTLTRANGTVAAQLGVRLTVTAAVSE
jgi:hypothetical protein